MRTICFGKCFAVASNISRALPGCGAAILSLPIPCTPTSRSQLYSGHARTGNKRYMQGCAVRLYFFIRVLKLTRADAGSTASLIFSMEHAAPEVLHALEAGSRTIRGDAAVDIWAVDIWG